MGKMIEKIFQGTVNAKPVKHPNERQFKIKEAVEDAYVYIRVEGSARAAKKNARKLSLFESSLARLSTIYLIDEPSLRKQYGDRDIMSMYHGRKDFPKNLREIVSDVLQNHPKEFERMSTIVNFADINAAIKILKVEQELTINNLTK